MGTGTRSSAPPLADAQWEEMFLVDWSIPDQKKYPYRQALQTLRGTNNRPHSARVLFGDDASSYRNGPNQMNEFFRRKSLTVRLKRIVPPGTPFHCEAGERLFALVPVD